MLEWKKPNVFKKLPKNYQNTAILFKTWRFQNAQKMAKYLGYFAQKIAPNSIQNAQKWPNIWASLHNKLFPTTFQNSTIFPLWRYL